MSESRMVIHAGARPLMKGRQELLGLETPDSTLTHTVVPHFTVVEKLIQALAYRNIDIVDDQYALSADSNVVFGLLPTSIVHEEVRLTIALRNSHNKSSALALAAGFNVFICDNMALYGEFEPLNLRHSKNMLAKLDDAITIGVDRTQRYFEPMRAAIDVWKGHSLTDAQAEALIYKAFVREALEAPFHLMKDVHQAYYEPKHEAFAPRTLWSLHNAFTEAFKLLKPVPMLRAMETLPRVIDVTEG